MKYGRSKLGRFHGEEDVVRPGAARQSAVKYNASPTKPAPTIRNIIR